MNPLRLRWLRFLVAGVVLTVPACKPKDRNDTLAGSWRLDAGLAVATATYAPDHTYILTVDGMAKGFTTGKWWIEGDQLLTTVGQSTLGTNAPGSTEAATIVKLDESVLIVKTERAGKVEMSTFQRVNGGGNTAPATAPPDTVAAAQPPGKPAPAHSNIEGGFGKKLGEVFQPAAGETNLLCKFTPQAPFRSFDKYRVMVTPVSHRIHFISASASFADYEAAQKEQQVVLAMLQNQFGGTFVRRGGDEYKLEKGDQSIEVNVDSGIDANETVAVQFSDESLYKEGEAERAKAAQAESTRSDSGGLFATTEANTTPGPRPPPASPTQSQDEPATPRPSRPADTPRAADLSHQLEEVIRHSAEVDRRAAVTAPPAAEPPPPPEPAATPTPRRLPEQEWDRPHVYLHIADEAQRPVAENIRQRFTKEGYLVVGIENVGGNDQVPPEISELHYFDPSDHEEAEEVAGKLHPVFGADGIHTAFPTGGGYVSHGRQYELWFSRTFRDEPGPDRLKAEQIASWNVGRVQNAIDEIYARHGTEFPRRDVQDWANRQSWYHRVPGLSADAAELTFNADERANVELLAARREALKAPARK